MTEKPSKHESAPSGPRPSPLPFDPADLVAMRVNCAEYARMVGVSKQTVSEWKEKGYFAVGPDGRFDPAKATRRVIECADPARLRARLFRHASATHAELRRRIEVLEAERLAEKAQAAQRIEDVKTAMRFSAMDGLQRLFSAVADRFDEMTAAREAGRLAAWWDEVEAVAFWEWSIEDYRQSLADEDAEDAASGCLRTAPADCFPGIGPTREKPGTPES